MYLCDFNYMPTLTSYIISALSIRSKMGQAKSARVQSALACKFPLVKPAVGHLEETVLDRIFLNLALRYPDSPHLGYAAIADLLPFPVRFRPMSRAGSVA